MCVACVLDAILSKWGQVGGGVGAYLVGFILFWAILSGCGDCLVWVCAQFVLRRRPFVGQLVPFVGKAVI
jgi:hypothetical protein